MKVLFVTAAYPSHASPYDAIFVREHARAVARHDDVAVIHLHPAEAPEAARRGLVPVSDPEISLGVPLFRLPWRPLPVPRWSFVPQVRAALAALEEILAVAGRPDVVHAHVFEAGLPALAIAARLRLPLVVTEHHTGFCTGSLPRLAILKARTVFRRAARVLPVSAGLREGLVASGVTARFTVVPNAIDLELFTPPPALEERVEDEGRLLFVGALIPRKNVAALLEAVARLAPARPALSVDVVGEGPERGALERLAGELGLGGRVRFHPFRPKAELAGLMRRARLLALPSHMETQGCVLLEAMACGTPVVATAVGGVTEVVTPDVGRLVPPGDSAALAHAIDEVLSIPWRRELLATRVASRFGHEAVGAAIHRVYEEVVQSDAPPAGSAP